MMTKLEKILKKKLLNLKVKKIIANNNAADYWEEAVNSINKKLNNKTKVVYLKNKILKINCDNFPVAAELMMEKNNLIKWFLKEKKQEIKNIIFIN